MPPLSWSGPMVVEFLGRDFMASVNSVHIFLSRIIAEGNNVNRGYGGNMTDPESDELVGYLDKLIAGAERLELDATIEGCRQIRMFVTGGPNRTPSRMIGVTAGSLTTLIAALYSELGKPRFAYIPRDKAKYFRQDALFGPEVAVVFPFAAEDIRDAGTCLALGMDTSAISHLMRVAEHGLRRMAHSLGVRNIGKNNKPIEYANWNDILNALEIKLEALNQQKPGVKRAAALTHYAELNMQIRAFKDCWRNDYAHGRKTYTPSETARILDHVERFMRALAGRSRKPKAVSLSVSSASPSGVPTSSPSRSGG